MSLSEEIQLDRKRWIELLNSSNYIQVTGDLEKFDEVTGESKGYCVMGIGGLLQHGEVGPEPVHDEDDIGNLFGLTHKQVEYLIAMNDGGEMDIPTGNVILAEGFEKLYVAEKKRIRSRTALARDFVFIGRWIEIVTALQRMV